MDVQALLAWGCGSGSQRRHVTLGRSARDSDARFRSGRPAQALGLSCLSWMGGNRIQLTVAIATLSSAMLEIRRGQLEPPFCICTQYPSKSRRRPFLYSRSSRVIQQLQLLFPISFCIRVCGTRRRNGLGRLSWLSSPSCSNVTVMVTARVQPRPLKQHVTNRLIRSLPS